MRIWCKLFEKNHMLKDTVMENYDMSMSRTAKVYDCLERACYEFDLEHIDFDYLDFQVIEED